MPQPCSWVAVLVALAASGLAAAQPQSDTQRTEPADAAAAVPAAALITTEPEPKSLAVWFGHVESDNLTRSVIPEEGSYESLGLLLGLGRTSTRLDASIDADLDYRDYSLDTLENETIGTLNAAAEVDIVQDRFSWTLTDDYGQGLSDPFSGIGPGNREQINVISTGPRIALPIGGRTRVEINGTYSERRFDESASVNTDSALSELGLYRQMSSTARVGIVASSNDIEYVDVTAPDYQIDRLSLRYEKELATGRVLADVGTNEISAAGFENDGPLYNFVWTRSLTTRSQLSVQAAQEFTDSGGQVVPGLDDESFTDVVVTPNPFEQRRFGVSYVLTMSRTVLSADIQALEDEHLGISVYDNDSTTMRLSFVRTISPRLSFGVGYETIERDFTDDVAAQPDGEDSRADAWLNRTLGRRFSLGVAISSYERRGIASYDERRYELRFGYSPTDSGGPAMASVGR